MPLLFLVFIGSALAQLPVNYQLERDWLIDGASFKAEINEDDQGRLILSNGLVERVIDTRLGTTVKFRNLMTGENLIRAVEPEGSLTLDGNRYSIGGAEGQHIRAYLTDSCLDELRPLEGAMFLVGKELSKPLERLKWKRVRHHSPDAVWPPQGVYLKLIYELPRQSRDFSKILSTLPSDAARERLFEDGFTELKACWKVFKNRAFERSSFVNEGKPGEIFTRSNAAVFAERAIPEGARLLEAEIHAGTDESTSWGPGIGVVFAQGQVCKFHLRPGGLAGVNRPVLGVSRPEGELPNVSGDEEISLAVPWNLRVRLEAGKLCFDAKPLKGKWKSYYEQVVPESWGKAIRFRVGKLSKTGGADDGPKDERCVRLKVENVAFYSDADASGLAELASPPKCRVSVHYELYDGIPALSKWITVRNLSEKVVTVDRFNAETLSVIEYENQVETRDGVEPLAPRSLHVETSMAFGGFTHRNANRHTVNWLADKRYRSQSNYRREQPCLLKVEPTFGPAQEVKAGGEFESFRVFEMVYDSEERERRGLALRRFYRVLAPWVTENPLMLHCRSSQEEVIYHAIDQAAAVGFEMVILSFGSGFDAENDDPKYLAHWKRIADYGKSKGIHLGAYSLYSSRSGGVGNDIVPPQGMQNAHGTCPAITSPWGQTYLGKLNTLFAATGFMVFEHDGPYPGDVDVTSRPPLQKGIEDSRWVHWKTWTDFYQKLRSEGVYMNLPDYYFLSGSNKCGMGYREMNWSLPRAQQRIITRQNIYDGTWQKTPSMGWMFVPLTEYQGGGAAATIEPLEQHLDHYRNMLLSNLGMGVQACYRGPRLYDTDKTKAMLVKWVAWFKKHREILESDLIHGRRADGQALDWMLHVNPRAKEKAMLVVYNSTGEPCKETLRVPLYYAGLRESSEVAVNGSESTSLELDAMHRATLEVEVPADGFYYAVFR